MARISQLPQTLTRWRSGGKDKYGQPTGYIIEVIPCRYEEANRLYVREDGQHERSRATIYTGSDSLDLGDMVAVGDHSSSSTPIGGSFEIKNKRITTNQRGTRTEYRYIF